MGRNIPTHPTVFLDWKEPIDGGQVGAYKVQRRERPAGDWSDVARAMESEITLNGQTRSKEFKYRLPLADCQYESLPIFGWPPRVARCLKVVGRCLTVAGDCLKGAGGCLKVMGGCLTVAGDCLTVESRCLKVAGDCLTVESRCLKVASGCLKVAGGCLTVEGRCRAAKPLSRTEEKIFLAAELRNCMLISQL